VEGVGTAGEGFLEGSVAPDAFECHGADSQALGEVGGTTTAAPFAETWDRQHGTVGSPWPGR
jgi:hypothetical protein